MADSFRSNSKKDTAALAYHLMLTFLLTTATACYAYLPFRKEVGDSAVANGTLKGDNITVKSLKHGEYKENLTFMVVIYTGFGTGALAAGLTSYFTSPKQITKISSKLLILFSMLGACVINDSVAVHHVVWFFIGFCAFAWWAIAFIHTVESVPGNWIVYVGVGLFGLGWSMARLYSILLVVLIEDWKSRLFWNSFFLFCIITAQDVIPFPKLKNTAEDSKNGKETMADLFRNSYGRRYFVCLTVLWMVHGYIFYGISHQIYNDSLNANVYDSVTDAIAILLALFLCVKTGQKRTIIGTLLLLSGLCQFAMLNAKVMGNQTKTILTLAHIQSFLITSSWHILWLFSIEIIGRGARYATTVLRYCVQYMSTT